jgi:hypothetical protein
MESLGGDEARIVASEPTLARLVGGLGGEGVVPWWYVIIRRAIVSAEKKKEWAGVMRVGGKESFRKKTSPVQEFLVHISHVIPVRVAHPHRHWFQVRLFKVRTCFSLFQDELNILDGGIP